MYTSNFFYFNYTRALNSYQCTKQLLFDVFDTNLAFFLDFFDIICIINNKVIQMNNIDNIVAIDITSAFTVTSAKGKTETMTNRLTYGLSFCLDGQITYMHNGKSFVSDKNHAVLLPQGGSYTIYRDKNGIFPLINFTAEGIFLDTFRVIPIKNTSSYIRDFDRIKSLLLFDGTRA